MWYFGDTVLFSFEDISFNTSNVPLQCHPCQSLEQIKEEEETYFDKMKEEAIRIDLRSKRIKSNLIKRDLFKGLMAVHICPQYCLTGFFY